MAGIARNIGLLADIGISEGGDGVEAAGLDSGVSIAPTLDGDASAGANSDALADKASSVTGGEVTNEASPTAAIHASISNAALALNNKAIEAIVPFLKGVSGDIQWLTLLLNWIDFEAENPPNGVYFTSIIVI